MKKLLYLVHRLPYPPNKGDKISSYNMLNYFSSNWRIHLGTFIDDPDDWEYTEVVNGICEDTCILPLPSHKKITGSILGLLRRQSLSLNYYDNKELQRWVVENVERECPDAVLIYSGVMGRFVRDILPPHVPVIFDAEDVDSEKWRSYADSRPWPLSWLYRREADKLLEFERQMSRETTISLFISEQEANLYKQLAPESVDKIRFRTQGVDSSYFDPNLDYENPYSEGEKVLVFAGAMDYWPNIEAVQWFCDHVLAKLREQQPDLLFCIVGMKPTEKVRQGSFAVTSN